MFNNSAGTGPLDLPRSWRMSITGGIIGWGCAIWSGICRMRGEIRPTSVRYSRVNNDGMCRTQSSDRAGQVTVMNEP
jgi:hypothetical protein